MLSAAFVSHYNYYRNFETFSGNTDLEHRRKERK